MSVDNVISRLLVQTYRKFETLDAVVMPGVEGQDLASFGSVGNFMYSSVLTLFRRDFSPSNNRIKSILRGRSSIGVVSTVWKSQVGILIGMQTLQHIKSKRFPISISQYSIHIQFYILDILGTGRFLVSSRRYHSGISSRKYADKGELDCPRLACKNKPVRHIHDIHDDTELRINFHVWKIYSCHVSWCNFRFAIFNSPGILIAELKDYLLPPWKKVKAICFSVWGIEEQTTQLQKNNNETNAFPSSYCCFRKASSALALISSLH